ncbi:HIT family protein, partial [Lactobacillus salivarius]|nr:HIT family protein [Ligilactobacillus salivarius]
IPRYSKKEGFGLRFDDNSSKYDSKKLQEIANQIASKVEK